MDKSIGQLMREALQEMEADRAARLAKIQPGVYKRQDGLRIVIHAVNAKRQTALISYYSGYADRQVTEIMPLTAVPENLEKIDELPL